MEGQASLTFWWGRALPQIHWNICPSLCLSPNQTPTKIGPSHPHPTSSLKLNTTLDTRTFEMHFQLPKLVEWCTARPCQLHVRSMLMLQGSMAYVLHLAPPLYSSLTKDPCFLFYHADPSLAAAKTVPTTLFVLLHYFP